MQSVCKVRSRLEGFLGPFFLATAGILATALSAMSAQDITRLHGGTGHHGASQGFTRPHEASWRLRRIIGFMPAQILVTRTVLVTALVTDLVTRFSSNSYVFL